MSSNWIRYRLEELGDIVTGKTPPSKVQDAFSVSGVQFVTPRDMDSRRWIDSTERYLSKSGVSAVKKSLVPLNSVAVSCIGSNMGKVVLLSNTSVTNQQINTIVVDTEKFNPTFIYYILSTKQDTLKNIAGGSATPILNKGHFGKFEIELPSKDEQDRLVKYLDCLDSKTAINTQIDQTLEQIAQALFKSWFVDFDPVRAKISALEAGGTAIDAELAAMGMIAAKSPEQLAELKQSKPDAYKQLAQTAALFPSAMQESEIGEIPEGWATTGFKQIVEKYIDNRGKTPPTVSKGIPLLEVKHLPEKQINPNLNTEKRVTKETYNNWFRAHLQKDDLIMSTVGTIGRLCLIPDNKKLGIAQNILGLRFKTDHVSPIFMLYQMSSRRFEHDVNARLVITVQPSIKRKDLETIDLLNPPLRLQLAFANIVKPMVEMQQRDENLNLAHTRDSLLPKLLSGELSHTENITPEAEVC